MSLCFVSLGRLVSKNIINILGDAISVEVQEPDTLIASLEPVNEIVCELREE